MKASGILGFVLVGASSVFGAAVEKRQSAQRYCGANQYTINRQTQAYQYVQTLETQGMTIQGTQGSPFPHNFNNRENLVFPDCTGQAPPFREWPILSSGQLFTTSDTPGPDRIVYKVTANDTTTGLPSTFMYCGVMTHTGAPTRNGFVLCSDA